ncbi:MAG: type I secretion system permease/ATPase [Hyphomicrobiaceae bacterium]|nr:type I secretion system permease/ATPase [Hyphomicrobiaceae bacterium]
MAERKTSLFSPGPLVDALKESRGTIATVGLFSSIVNVLYLTGSLYMLQIYDRVLASRSIPTLLALSLFVLAAYTFQGIFDVLRQRITVRMASVFDEKLQDVTHKAVITLGVMSKTPGEAMGPVRQVDTIRSFATSAGPTALLDAPWVPFYLAICFLIHPWLGWLSLAGSIVLTIIAILTERVSRDSVRQANVDQGVRGAVIEGDRHNSESVIAMGMQPQLLGRWRHINGKFLASVERSADVVNSFGAVTKSFRMALQSSVLGLGALLVIFGQLSPGSMIMASIMMGRALNPIEVAVGNFRSFIAARDAFKLLNEKLGEFAKEKAVTELPAPTQTLEVEGLVVAPPHANKATLNGINFGLRAGEAMGLIGPSGTGKTSLARVLVGIWEPARGAVRLDGAELDQWRNETLGASIGFLAQEVGLFDGTIAQNIARMSENPDSSAVLAAARAAGAHDLILGMPEGYDTRIGEGGSFLSAGQRQRIALARALYGDPFLIVLDEPQSNLDAEGENALLNAIQGAKARGAIVIVISHRPSTLAGCDKVLVVANGGQQGFGPRDEVLRQVLAQPANVQNTGQSGGVELRRGDEEDGE